METTTGIARNVLNFALVAIVLGTALFAGFSFASADPAPMRETVPVQIEVDEVAPAMDAYLAKVAPKKRG